MNQLTLSDGGRIQTSLVHQPESGMGYQNTQIYLKDGRMFQTSVYGGTIIVLPEEFSNIAEDDITHVKVV